MLSFFNTFGHFLIVIQDLSFRFENSFSISVDYGGNPF